MQLVTALHTNEWSMQQIYVHGKTSLKPYKIVKLLKISLQEISNCKIGQQAY